MTPERILITGGARSGKSARAVALAFEYSAGGRFFIATGEARDEEMRRRIERHRDDRGDGFETIEAPVDVIGAMLSLSSCAAVIVLDCLTLWVSNLMEHGMSDEVILAEGARLAEVIRHGEFATIIVTDEVGAGIVPIHPAARRFRDLLGWTNQRVAQACERVVLMVAGQALTIKGAGPDRER